jgi:Uncharacterized conserved protein, contains double-stranded beta-helix domain
MLTSHFEIHRRFPERFAIRVVLHDENYVMVEMKIGKGVSFPEHFHQRQHSAYLAKGKLKVIAGGIISIFTSGESWCIDRGITHLTEVLEDSVMLEVYRREEEPEEFYAAALDVGRIYS